MRLAVRLLALLVVVPSTYCYIYWMVFSLIPVGYQDWISLLGSLLCALGAGWYVWAKLGSVSANLASCIFSGALLLGGVGFSAGFFGPIIFSPGANQGPLLGLFITGPMGFLLGGLAGLVYWLTREERNLSNSKDKGSGTISADA